MHSLLVELDLGRLAGPVYASLKPELQATIPSERSRASLELSGEVLKVFIIAEDVVSLRAAMNTWLRLIKISEDMFNVRVIS